LARKRRFRTFDEAFEWLSSRTNYETMAVQRYDARTYGLSRVERLLDHVGRPDRAFDVVQVVGSKGKGSTATALASILRASGRRVGLFTSPHLVDPRERIAVNGRPASDRLVRDALARLAPLVDAAAADGTPVTFFEVHTAAALLAFRDARCDAVVLEAGMGGRLDATTAAVAVAKVLTSVSLDHVRQLGRTRAAIAREKAAAARRGVPFVSGVPADSDVGRVIARVCAGVGAPLLALGRDFEVSDVVTSFDRATGAARTDFDLLSCGGEACLAPALIPIRNDERRGKPRPHKGQVSRLSIPLLGEHQATNAALAAVAALRTPWRGAPVTAEHVRRGLAATRIRARLQTLSTRPLVLVDGAHNPASMRLLARTVREVAPVGPRVFVVGMAADKDVTGCLRRLRGTADLVLATTSGQARAASPADLAARARAVGLRARPARDLSSALAEAKRRAGGRGVVVVTGSLYLCGSCLSL
jgi:folylpolyglutamate synthase/dihydrofolate synthase